MSKTLSNVLSVGFWPTASHCFRTNTISGLAKAGCLVAFSLTLFVPGLVISGSYAYDPTKTEVLAKDDA
ncbi:hypothetical protein IGI04_043116 [Brassica rapa subsp. trilocularis]|uniref:Uncharacterized protein n=1 Tax=Brassica rapa subsp. trilocularis TaxID=1813537 RepID=A0ABQ7KK82_BRACM|nr:hypothetical protein IGI04_043116 [Brassica rapa subsp. trilocularis]